MRTTILLFVLLMLPALDGAAGQSAPLPKSAEVVDGPPAPLPPSVISRDAAGHATVRAVRLASPLRIDGRLDEAVYRDVPPMSDFIQNDPKEGAPADEKTEMWVFFDRDNIYVVCRCWESHPERRVANEMRRDNTTMVQNDQFAWSFDTFHDRRNSFFFQVTPAGGRIDGQATNERQFNLDWNPIWQFKAGRFANGYVVEAAIPFKSLRYKPGASQIWGLQARRHSSWRNEDSFLTLVPASAGNLGLLRSSFAATMVGLQAPSGSKNLEIKPYTTAHVTTDKTVSPAITNDAGGAIGVDAKYGITQSLTADLTYNTDFAQVEADEQQINLTRFNLFFPEKRDFFLENSGTFAFGGIATSGSAASSTETPILFYSRQIGLAQGRVVPIRVGGRLTGRAGRFTLGLLNVHSGDEPVLRTGATNFSVLRIKRDILRKSSVGLIFTGRSVGQAALGRNEAYGIDGSFAFFADLAINTYWARTRTEGVSGDDADSYRAQLDYTGDRYGVQGEHLAVGQGFDPQVGFARRRDMHKDFALIRFSPRPKQNKIVRKYSWTGSFTHIENGAHHLETRTLDTQFEVQLQNSDKFFVGYTDNYEFIPQEFRIATGVTLPVAGYDFGSGRIGYNFGRQRSLSGNISVDRGTFYNGRKTAVSVSSGRLNLGPQLSIEPNLSINKVQVMEGAFTTRLVGARVTHTMTPLMFASALIQYNSGTHSVAANVRLRWEYQPGSELFVVYNEQRDTFARTFAGLDNRSFIVKINRLFRF